MVDQDLRRRQQDQHAGAGRGIDDGHRGRQSRAEPAAEQDRIRNVADEGDAETDAKPEAQLELPEMLGMGGDQECAAEQQQSERIDGARPRAIEQPADQRRREAAGKRRSASRPRPPAARSQPKLSEIGFRNTVKLSPRPRPSTDSAKHSASTLSATRAGFGGFAQRFPRRGAFLIHDAAGSAFPRCREQGSKANAPMQA